MDIDEMTVGRELDARVAELVMGWSDVQLNAYTPYGQDACGTVPGATDMTWNVGRKAIPHYSSNIADAWLIVEHLKGVGIGVEIHCRNRNVRVMCVSPDIVVEAETAPLAICRASLKATLAATGQKEG